MASKNGKVMALQEAIANYVKDDCHLSIGGFTLNRNPMAAVYEIIRQQKKRLHVYAHSNGQGVDELIGAGCVSKLEIAYSGTGRFGPTCIRFRKAIESGAIQVEDYSNFQMTLRFMAGALDIPYLPTRSGFGTDIINKWGFRKEIRIEDSKIPNDKLIIQKNPFDGWMNIKDLILVPAITPDVTIIHVQKSDEEGTCVINGLPFSDVEQAKSSKNVIVTCEELVQKNELRIDSDKNKIPPFVVDAVVPIKFGAYPTACYGYYDYDPKYLKAYSESAYEEDTYEDYLKKYIFDAGTHSEFIDIVGKKNLDDIKADPSTGYATNLDRICEGMI